MRSEPDRRRCSDVDVDVDVDVRLSKKPSVVVVEIACLDCCERPSPPPLPPRRHSIVPCWSPIPVPHNAEGDAFPLAFRIDGPIGTPAPAPGSSREMTPRGLGALTTTTSGGGGGSIFSSAASSSPNDIYPAPPAPVGFGLTVHHQVPLPHGGAGLRSAGQGVQGTYGGTISGASSSLSKAWVSGDTWATGEAISPSKCLSLSPVKPAGSTSTSPSK